VVAHGARAPTWWPLALALAALALGGWNWLDARREGAQLQAELARKLAEVDVTGRETRGLADQVRNTVREVESRMGLLEARLIETQNQRVALEAMYQELARNRDDWVLSEIEQIVVAASQQLQLAGNVSAALTALESADKRLAASDRPYLIPVRRALARDIDRLRALPAVDVPGLTLRLDNLVAAIDGLPLAAERRPAMPVAKPEAAPASGFWKRLGSEAWQDLRELLRIRAVSGPEAPLLAPEQAYFVRENLRLKLLSARLALLARDDLAFRNDLKTAARWIDQQFDTSAKPVASMASQLKQLSGADTNLRLPDISDSLEALRAQRARRGR
jgi:uroporphyrin-3 C-methyltransferase